MPPKKGFYEERLPPIDKDAEMKEAKGAMEDLIKAAGDLKDLRRRFYSPLLKKLESENEVTPSRLAAIFDSALEKYAAGDESSDINYIRQRAPELIRAIAQGNTELGEATLELWKARQKF